MQEAIPTKDTVFKLRTYATAGGWKWEIEHFPVNGDPSTAIRATSEKLFADESEAFADGHRWLALQTGK